jgi:WD40-like Beta Propeller Repeat
VTQVSPRSTWLPEAQRLLVHATGAENPSWSPDGRRIAFVRDNGDATSNVYVAGLDGSQPRLVGPGSDETLSWSPDSTRIAYGTEFFCGAVGGAAHAKVVVVDVSAARTVLSIPGIAGAAAGYASWSPDGTRLVFERANTAGSCLEEGGDAWIVNADGTGLSQVTSAFPFAGGSSPPTWWPGQLGIVPDPPIRTVALHTIARRSVRRGSYSIVGADRARVAINRSHERDIYSAVGVWRGSGRAAWSLTTEPGAETAAFAGARVYWTSSDFVPGYFFAYLYSAAHPGRRPRLLRSRTESTDSWNPFFSVGGDGSLAVFTSHGSLWRLRGVRARRIRHERTQFSLLAVGGGRVLLQRTDRRVELLSSNGRLLRKIRSRVNVGGALSGRRLVLVGSRRIAVYDARTGRLRARWPVGAPGLTPTVGFMYKSLLPYGDGSALHVLDVDTGHDVIMRIPGVTAPVSGAVTKAGLIYTWTQTYSISPGRMAVVPLRDLTAAVRAAGPAA